MWMGAVYNKIQKPAVAMGLYANGNELKKRLEKLLVCS